MSLKLKPLNEQVIVITGASSGIGLATANAAAKQGARLVLAARSENALKAIAESMQAVAAEAIAVTCDVADWHQVDALAKEARRRFGRIDTWVNNAGQAVYGRLDEVSDEDSRRLFDVNFWGIVYGSLAALPSLKVQGGALINLGSELSEAYVPLLGMYTATKHAVKGFTDSLRVEIEVVDKSPISITLIEPTAVDTPFPQHARNYQHFEPKLPSPMIDPHDVANAILEAAVTPTRQKKVGMLASIHTGMAAHMPNLTDYFSGKQVDKQHYDEPPRVPLGVLNQSSEDAGLVCQTHGTGGRVSK